MGYNLCARDDKLVYDEGEFGWNRLLDDDLMRESNMSEGAIDLFRSWEISSCFLCLERLGVVSFVWRGGELFCLFVVGLCGLGCGGAKMGSLMYDNGVFSCTWWTLAMVGAWRKKWLVN